MVYLTVLDVGAHMPPRIEIPEIVPMRDPEIVDALSEAEQARLEERYFIDARTFEQLAQLVTLHSQGSALDLADLRVTATDVRAGLLSRLPCGEPIPPAARSLQNGSLTASPSSASPCRRSRRGREPLPVR